MDAKLLRESITFAALGSLAQELTGKPAEELLSAETIAQIDAVISANEPYDSLGALAELLTLLDESAARIIALIPEGGGNNSEETDADTAA